jgi:hypothetical protein
VKAVGSTISAESAPAFSPGAARFRTVAPVKIAVFRPEICPFGDSSLTLPADHPNRFLSTDSRPRRPTARVAHLAAASGERLQAMRTNMLTWLLLPALMAATAGDAAGQC